VSITGSSTVIGGPVVNGPALATSYGTRAFEYSADNLLTRSTWSSGITTSTSTHVYDGSGRRTLQRGSTNLLAEQRIHSISDELDIVVESSGVARVEQHVHALGRRLMTLSRAIGSLTVNETHYLQDRQGSVRATFDRWGAELSRIDYLPFGKRDLSGSNGAQRFGFTGEELNIVGGLYYHGARFYDPDLCRFISADSLVPDPARGIGFNRYAYAYNNPITYIDPNGHEPISATTVLIGAAIGAAIGGAAATGGENGAGADGDGGNGAAGSGAGAACGGMATGGGAGANGAGAGAGAKGAGAGGGAATIGGGAGAGGAPGGVGAPGGGAPVAGRVGITGAAYPNMVFAAPPAGGVAGRAAGAGGWSPPGLAGAAGIGRPQ
jgi:RHS repeat-associated protein